LLEQAIIVLLDSFALREFRALIYLLDPAFTMG